MNEDLTVSKLVVLNTPKDVNEFVAINNTFYGTIDCIESHRNIDGKSIMGVYSMDLSKPINVVYHGATGSEEIFKTLARWEVAICG